MSGRYLLDTVTVSELAKPRGLPAVRDWLDANGEASWISVLTFGEIVVGIDRVAPRNPPLGDRLVRFITAIEANYRDRTIPFGLNEAKQWGRLVVGLGYNSTDLQLAATALVHDLTVVTRNVRHFAPAGVRVVNPWEAN